MQNNVEDRHTERMVREAVDAADEKGGKKLTKKVCLGKLLATRVLGVKYD